MQTESWCGTTRCPCNSTSRESCITEYCKQANNPCRTHTQKNRTLRCFRRCGWWAMSVPWPVAFAAASRASTLCSQSCRTPRGRLMDTLESVSLVRMASWRVALLRTVACGTCTDEPSGRHKTTSSSLSVTGMLSYSCDMLQGFAGREASACNEVPGTRFELTSWDAQDRYCPAFAIEIDEEHAPHNICPRVSDCRH